MRARRHRKNFWLWMLAAATLMLPAQPIVAASAKGSAPVKRAAAPHRAAPTLPGVTLQVQSARDSLAYSAGNPTAAQKFDSIPYVPQPGEVAKPNAPKDYKWLINLDNTGNTQGGKDSAVCHPSTNPAYPAGCTWPSIHYATASPALSEGTSSDWGINQALPTYTISTASTTTTGINTAGQPVLNVSSGVGFGNGVEIRIGSGITQETGVIAFGGGTTTLTLQANLGFAHANGEPVTGGSARGLPDTCDVYGNPVPHGLGGVAQAGTVACRYLVSVSADGYQLGGTHFSVGYSAPAAPQLVNVFLNPLPIPLGTMRLRVFNDSHPTDGQFDQLTEKGLEGFLGVVFDVDGILQADFYGNALCTVYKTDASGKIMIDQFGKPTAMPVAEPAPRDPVTHYYNPTVPGRCQSDSNGDIVIPNLAPNHYSARVTPPDFDPNALVGSNATHHWLQTTTLEGNHDHDVWVMPNDTGLDTELVVGGEAVPFVDFGFVAATSVPTDWALGCPANSAPGTSGCGQIKGQLYGATAFSPGVGAIAQVPLAGSAGLRLDRPIDRGWVALNNLNTSTGDSEAMVANVPTDAQGHFTFSNVPDGDYQVTVYDEPQEYILDMVTVTISHGQMIDMGVLPLNGWFSHIFGHVFIDLNGNGRQDPGEPGLFHAFVQNLNRTNNTMVGGISTQYSDNNGFYDFKEAYPLGLMSINQFFNTRYKTVGITYQSCNDPKEHTVVAPMVDVSYLPLISQCGRLDWGVVPYSPSANGDNGGIVATMLYDQTRQKYNARQAQSGDFQTGIPGFRFEQYTPIKALPTDPTVDIVTGMTLVDPMTGYRLRTDTGHEGQFQTVENLTNPDGQDCGSIPGGFTPGVTPLCYVSENNGPPAKCYPKDVNGAPLGYDPANPQSFDFVLNGGACIESPASGLQIGLGTDGKHAVQTVDGNYGLGNASTVPAKNLGDTLVRAVVPVDNVLGTCDRTPTAPGCDAIQIALHLGRKLYSYTAEEDVNLFSGPQFVPQGANLSSLPWPPAVGPVSQMPVGNYDENQFTTSPGIDPVCSGVTHVVHVTNPDLLANGGSPLEGQTRHSCDMKLLNVQAGQSIAPNFHVRTSVDIALPTHYFGLMLDDVSVQASRKNTLIGEVAGIPGVPIGVYDWTGRRMGNATSDFNGMYEILMPSESLNNCPVPAGTCPNVYRFVGNDPGQPGNPNLNYDPNFRTISSNFEAWPNMLVPADNAPTRVVTNINSPGLTFTASSPCGIKDLEPQLFAVGPNPYTFAADAPETITITGANFGTAGHVEFKRLNASSTDLPVQLRLAPGTSWTNNQVHVLIGANEVGDVGPGSLTVVNTSAVDPTTGKNPRSTSGLTFHVLGGGYSPHLITVGPGKDIDPFALDAAGKLVYPFPIQEALDRAAAAWQTYGIAHVDGTHTVSQVANDPNERYMVVVYPNWSTNPDLNPPFVPLGTYYENLIIHSPLKLQGVGPGGNYVDPAGVTQSVQGSIIDGRFFTAVTANTDIGAAPNPATDNTEPAILHWVNLLASIQNSTHGTGFRPASPLDPNSPPWTGQQSPLGEGAVITVVGTQGTYPAGYPDGSPAAVDGFTISGGDQKDFPGNISQMGGGVVRETGAGLPGQPVGAVNTQGGAVYLNGGTDNFQISNNLVRQNSGSYGAIRVGTPLHGSPQSDGGASHNYNVAISHNQVAFNGATNLAGAVGLFSDSNNYSVDHNTFCMNMALEYGGAVSHFGFSPNGSIDHNKMLLNSSVDEGGAIMVASEPAFTVVGGEQVADPAGMTQGSGAVSIDHNYMGINIAQDDGGAIRLMGTTGKGDPSGLRGLSPITVTNNMITNNISSHEGGGISMNDAPVVNIVNNTFSGNLSTATATTSNGAPAPAGVSSGSNSAGLMALLNSAQYAGQVPEWMLTGASVAGLDLPPAWPSFSSPLIENDIFADNRAGSWTPTGVAQLGLPGDSSAINRWDVGSIDGGAGLRVRNSLIYSDPGAPNQTWVNDGLNVISPAAAPGFISPYNACHTYPVVALEKGCLSIQVLQTRTYFRFRPAAIISVDLPDNAFGDYHLLNVGSPAHAIGANPQSLTTDSVVDDIDSNPRPAGPITAGAHEVTAPVPAPVVVPPVGPVAGVTPPPANRPAGNAPQVNAPAANPPLGTQGGALAPSFSSGPIPSLGAVRLAPIGRGNESGRAPASSAPSLGVGTPLAGFMAFESLPEHQGETGLAALVALSLILAGYQIWQAALRRRRQTVSVQSDEQNIEGGEQL